MKTMDDIKKTGRLPRSTAKRKSVGEELLAAHLQLLGIKFEREFKFCKDRKWRADFRITGTRYLVEVEGGVWSNGRHTRGKGYQADMDKYNTAVMLGYKVLRFSTERVKSGEASRMIEQALDV